MTTLEAYYSIRAPLITLSKIVGVEIWTTDNFFTPASYNVMTLVLIYNICNVYTLVTRATDPVKFMQITILFGTATQLVFKFFYTIFDKFAIRDICYLAEENIYRHYSNATSEENCIIQKTVRYLEIIWKAMTVLYTSTLFVFGLWPVYVYYTKGQLFPLFMYEIPMVDIEKRIGYLVTLLFQSSIYLIGVFGSIMADYLFIFVVFHAISCVDLFNLHVKELTSLLTTEIPEKDHNKIAEKWKCCMQDHQLATRFLNFIEDTFSMTCLVQVITCVYTICDGVVLVAITDWYAAFCFLIVVFGAMSGYFIIGHVVELKVDAMYESISDLPWNLLNVSQQKEYSYLLARSQRPLTLTLYRFGPLNLDTYTTVLRFLYKYFIMVMQYLR